MRTMQSGVLEPRDTENRMAEPCHVLLGAESKVSERDLEEREIAHKRRRCKDGGKKRRSRWVSGGGGAGKRGGAARKEEEGEAIRETASCAVLFFGHPLPPAYCPQLKQPPASSGPSLFSCVSNAQKRSCFSGALSQKLRRLGDLQHTKLIKTERWTVFIKIKIDNI